MLVNKLGVDVLLLMLCRFRFSKSFQSDNYVYYDLNNSALDFLKATFHLTIFIRGERATGKIQRNNCHHGSCGSSLTCQTSLVSLIFTHAGRIGMSKIVE